MILTGSMYNFSGIQSDFSWELMGTAGYSKMASWNIPELKRYFLAGKILEPNMGDSPGFARELFPGLVP